MRATLRLGQYRESAPAPRKRRAAEHDVPAYLRDVYAWAYLNPRNVRWLDHEAVVATILWGNHRRLQSAAFAELAPGQTVLQPACVYGGFSAALARFLGSCGRLEVIDIARIQVANCRRKLRSFPQARVRRADAADPGDGPYDAVCCYFLLHELPDGYKRAVVDALLASVRPGGKVVFVDYHRPIGIHPLKPLTSLVFDTLEPFAKGLWHREIRDLARDADDFSWRTEAYFGALFQKTVATARA